MGEVIFGDDVALAALRAKVLGWMAVSLAVTWPLAAVFEAGMRGPLTLVAAATGLVTGVLVLLAGSRLGDRGFLAVMLGFDAAVVWQVGQITDVASLTAIEFPLLAPIMVAAVFAGRRRHVAAVVLLTVVGGGWLASLHLAPADVPGEVIPDTAMFVIGGIVVRLLRDIAHRSLEVAHDALARAERGELTDPLTGLSNRRGLERFGTSAWQDQAGQGRPIALLVVDIDHFKRVNDTLGHAAGDELLRRVAQVFAQVMRSDDVLVRLGGEEFLALVPATATEALVLAERLRLAIERQLDPVTVSIGVHETIPAVSDELPTVLWSAVDAADRALYAAKEAGRNRVVAAGREVPLSS